MRIATLPPAQRSSGPVSEGRGVYFKRPGKLFPTGVGGGCCLRAACRENTPTRTRRGGAAIPLIWAAALGGSEQRSAAADCVSTEVPEGTIFLKIYLCVCVYLPAGTGHSRRAALLRGGGGAVPRGASRQPYWFLASRCVFLPNAVAPPKTPAWGGGGMNFFSCGCGALLRELSGPPPFSSFPLPALTLCAAPHRAPHFSLCFFFLAAPQPTGSAATLLPPPPPLFLLMAMAVRRRAVCGLALFALLCGCCAPSVCGVSAEEAAANVNVSVEVSCPNAAKKLRWRVADRSNSGWEECPQAVKGAESSESAAYGNTLCLLAGSVYMWKFPAGNCRASQPAGGTDAVAFRLACTAAANSALHKLSKGETVTISPTEDPLGASDECEYPNFSQPAAEVQSGPQQPSGQQQPAGTQQQPGAALPAASSAAQTPQGVRAGNGGSITVGEQPGSVVGSTGSQEPSTEGRRETPTPSAGNAASSTQTAGERAADGTKTTTTRSPSDGNDIKSNAGGSATNSNTTQKAVANAADRSATSTSFVCAPLMLLLTAALACAAA
ncbi:mucin-like glycoprotein [Trypanosoma conorhini]|uniref:Mucin-like glycoprotein n=1 Tax=Trypanosoma conorhini TaxID=83891 RepID=A0A3R7KMB5_9TRYP|nr:mucin-like glycoprotein [Trypanosoma conorhini]RNE97357.1 mucin-like glycoprotein [Trypanosoma conorhini]